MASARPGGQKQRAARPTATDTRERAMAHLTRTHGEVSPVVLVQGAWTGQSLFRMQKYADDVHRWAKEMSKVLLREPAKPPEIPQNLNMIPIGPLDRQFAHLTAVATSFYNVMMRAAAEVEGLAWSTPNPSRGYRHRVEGDYVHGLLRR